MNEVRSITRTRSSGLLGLRACRHLHALSRAWPTWKGTCAGRPLRIARNPSPATGIPSANMHLKAARAKLVQIRGIVQPSYAPQTAPSLLVQ